MIKKSIIVFIGLFVLYSIFILLKPKLSSSQHQWQDNLVKAQTYIYNDNDTINNLIIGSSLSSRLIMDSLPNFYNLSLGGQSIFDGLKILKAKNKLPSQIFIETNIILTLENTSFKNNFFSPFSFLEKHIISLRADKHPVPIFIEYLSALQYKLNSIFYKNNLENLNNKKNDVSISNSKIAPEPVLLNSDLFDKMLAMQIVEYSKQPDSILMANQFLLLKEYVSYFKSNNIKIHFFEMPINYKLNELIKSKNIRQAFFENFPPQEYHYIMPDSTKYATTDGLHLDKAEATQYTSYFKSQLVK